MNQDTQRNQDLSLQTEKLPYEPPQANFVPLQAEERLLACTKDGIACNAGLHMS